MGSHIVELPQSRIVGINPRVQEKVPTGKKDEGKDDESIGLDADLGEHQPDTYLLDLLVLANIVVGFSESVVVEKECGVVVGVVLLRVFLFNWDRELLHVLRHQPLESLVDLYGVLANLLNL